MRVLNLGVLELFIRTHADCRNWISNWLADVREASWLTPTDLKRRYPSASILTENYVIFNVRGNTYRLETQISYRQAVVYVKWIGTHAEYSKR
jgi:mRNA interferase HigB